jgi:hypothetical protein
VEVADWRAAIAVVGGGEAPRVDHREADDEDVIVGEPQVCGWRDLFPALEHDEGAEHGEVCARETALVDQQSLPRLPKKKFAPMECHIESGKLSALSSTRRS